MGLVEWTRLEGGQTEAVVAMLVNREHPNSVRITPSRGDGGVDILDRRAGPLGTDHVYQVKRYTAEDQASGDSLDARQKAEVENSLKALTTDPRWKDLTVNEWHLVVPVNPSPEAEHWLQELGRTYGLTAIWHGLEYLEQLAAKYPDVVDFYLHGGRAEILKAYQELNALVATGALPEDLTVPQVTARIQAALATLDHDPHYRYEYRFGEGAPPKPPTSEERPGIAMHFASLDGETGRWITVDVIARCAASAGERPITISGAFNAEPGSAFAQHLSDFFTFGTPFTSPEGAFEGSIDAPGGLGGELRGGTLTLGPADGADLGNDPELHFEILDENDAVIAEADVHRTERSTGPGGGIRVMLEEDIGVFTLETRADLVQGRAHRTVKLGDPTGVPVARARAALAFATEMHAPNRLRVSVRDTPPARGVTDPFIAFDWDKELLEELAKFLRALELLEFLQEYSSAVIRVPDFDTVTTKHVRDWRIAGAIIRGEKVTATYPEDHAMTVALDPSTTIPTGTFSIALPFQTEVGDQLVDLGMYETVLTDPTLIDSTERDGLVHHRFTTPDHKVEFRFHDPDPGPQTDEA